MMQNVYKFNKAEQKFEKCDVKYVMFEEIFKGPYVIRVGAEGSMKIYIVGLDDDVNDYMAATNKLFMPITELVNTYLNILYRSGRDVSSAELMGKTCAEVEETIQAATRRLPEVITYQKNPYGPDKKTPSSEISLADMVS